MFLLLPDAFYAFLTPTPLFHAAAETFFILHADAPPPSPDHIILITDPTSLRRRHAEHFHATPDCPLQRRRHAAHFA
jgi:hypothetical protein